jgi:hypothetical protein
MMYTRARRLPRKAAVALATTVALTVALSMSGMPALAAPDGSGASSPKPSVSPAQPKPMSAAEAATQAARTGKAVEVSADTTPTEQTMANPDGTFTTNLSALPVRVRHNNSWVGLDPTLRRNPDGTYSPAATPSRLVLSGGGTQPLATMTNGTATLSLSWPTTLPVPTVSGHSLTYGGVLPGVDLVVTASAQGGFNHVLVVHDAAAAANPAVASLHLTVATAGVSVAAQPAGDLRAVDGFGRTVFTAPVARMWDSTQAPANNPKNRHATAEPNPGDAPGQSSADGPGSAARTATVRAVVSGNSLTLTPDPTLLTGPGVAFPTYIDPAWNPDSTDTAQNAWTYVDSARPDQPYLNNRYNDGIARVGYQNFEGTPFKARSFFQFGIPGQIWDADILGATLQTKVVWSPDNTTHDVGVFHTGTIDTATTWNHQPAKGRLIDQRSVVANYAKAPNVWQEFDVTSEIADAAVHHWSATTLGLYNASETDPWAWRKFDHNPDIAITYNFPPDVPSRYATSPAVPCGGGLVGNTAVTFSATVSDRDGTQGQIEADFTITDQTTGKNLSTPTLTVSNHQTASVTLPASKFADGHTYGWNVNAFDGRSRSRQATPTCRLTIDHHQPDKPDVQSDTYPTDRFGPPARTPGTFTFTPPAGSDPPASYVYSLNTPPPAGLPRGGVLFPGAVVVPAAAAGGDTTVTITPHRVYTNVLYVYAVDAAGNPSTQPATYPFQTAAITTPDVAGDLTGDGVPDTAVVGTPTNPGLWLYAGTDKTGHVNPGLQIGDAGTGAPGSNGNTGDWTGAATSTADFNNDGIQDLLVRLPAADPDTGANARVLYGGGDGQPLDPAQNDNYEVPRLPTIDGSPGYQTVDQIAPSRAWTTGDVPWPDLYAVVGDNLYLYPATSPQGVYQRPQLVSAGWTHRTITAVTTTGNPALFARDTTTGELDLWTGDTANLIPAGDSRSTKTVYATGGFNATTTPTIDGADLDVDGKPDLWATTNSGKLNAYRNTGSNALAAPIVSPLAPTGPLRSGIFNKCLQDSGAGNPIQIQDCNGTDAQVWTDPGDGTIRVGGKCLDVGNVGTANGNPVSRYTCIPGAPAQQWQRTTHGGLRNPNANRCLDVNVATNAPKNGDPLQIWDCNAMTQQQFSFGSATGVFQSGIAGKCLNDQHGELKADNPVVIVDCNGTDAQTWSTPGDGTIRFHDNCLDTVGTGTGNGTKIGIKDCTTSVSQRWQTGPNNSLVNVGSGRCLDDPGASSTNFTQLQLWDCAANAAQYWGLRLSVTGPIRSKIPVKCVHDHANGGTDGTPVQLYDCNGTSAQNWTLPGDGTIRINGKCLDISFIGTQNKSVVALYTCLGGAVAQQWVTGSGNSVRNPNSGRCLDDPYATTTNETQLWIWDCNNGDAQTWRLPY